MIFRKDTKCMLDILRMLENSKSKYSVMFKKTKVSHTTLQKVLRFLAKKKFIKKYDIGHMNVDYEITDKGRKLLNSLLQLQETLS